MRVVEFAGLSAKWNPPESDHDMVSKFQAASLFDEPDQHEIVSILQKFFRQPIDDFYRYVKLPWRHLG